jgi:uncharacterized membrane protein
LCRGLAVVLMVAFHIVFDLDYFRFYSFNMDSYFWFYLARLVASIFILLVGLSLVLSHSRASRSGSEKGFFKKIIKRGLKIFCLGLLVTLVTYLQIGPGFIIFGILHFIGIAIILSYPFLRLGALNIIMAIFFIVIGLVFQAQTVNSPWLLWLGLLPQGFYMLDFFPIFPWFGLVLVGIYLGNTFYEGYERRFKLPDWSGLFPVKSLEILGRNSLLIYFIHPPIIIAALFILDIVELPVLWN